MGSKERAKKGLHKTVRVVWSIVRGIFFSFWYDVALVFKSANFGSMTVGTRTFGTWRLGPGPMVPRTHRPLTHSPRTFGTPGTRSPGCLVPLLHVIYIMKSYQK